MSVNITSVPDRVFVPTSWACSLECQGRRSDFNVCNLIIGLSDPGGMSHWGLYIIRVNKIALKGYRFHHPVRNARIALRVSKTGKYEEKNVSNSQISPPDRSADDPRKGYEIWERYPRRCARTVPCSDSCGYRRQLFYFPRNLACFFFFFFFLGGGGVRISLFRFCKGPTLCIKQRKPACF